MKIEKWINKEIRFLKNIKKKVGLSSYGEGRLFELNELKKYSSLSGHSDNEGKT